MKIERYKMQDGRTVYSIVPFLKKPQSIVVERDAPEEAHEHAKLKLVKTIEYRSLKSTVKRKIREIGYSLIKIK